MICDNLNKHFTMNVKYVVSMNYTLSKIIIIKKCLFDFNRKCSLTCRDVVKKKKVVIQTVKVIPSSNLRPRWWTMEVGGIPQNDSEAVEYLQKKKLFALLEVSFLKLSKTVIEYEFITKYSTKLIMNETKFIMFLKVIFPW